MAEPKRMRPMGIQKRLTLLLLVILLPLLALQGYRYFVIYQEKQEEALQANLEMARAVAKSFESFVQDVLRQELAIGFAITSSTKLTPGDINRLLEISRSYPAVRDFTWLNSEGVAIHSNNPAIIGTDYSDRSYVRDVIGGREWAVGELVIGKLFGKPIFGVSRGIRDDKGRLLGVVFAAVVPERLDAQLAIERSEGGAISLVDQQGMLVYRYPAIDIPWEDRNWLRIYPDYEEVFKGREISKIFFATYEGKDRLVGIVPISSIGWAAGAGRRKEDVTGPVVQSLVLDAILFLSVSLIAFLIAAALSRKITNPIGALRWYSSSLGNGEAPQKIDVEEVPELQDLAESFDNMAEKLRSRETTLRESEERYRVLVESAPDAVLVHRDGQFLYANSRALTLYGAKTLEQLRSKKVLDLIHPDDRPAIAERMQRGQAGQSLELRETKLVRLDGQVVPVESVGGAITYQGSPAVQIIVRDITARKQAEEELHESQERFRSVLESNSDVLYRRNLQSDRFDYVSPSVKSVAGYTPDEIMAMSPAEVLSLIHPDDISVYQAAIVRLEETGEAKVEYRQRSRDGKYRWLSNRMTFVRDAAGNPLFHYGSIRDVTAHRQAEEALRLSRERFSKAFNHSPNAITITRLRDGMIVEGNESAYGMLGYGHEEVVGKTTYDLNIWADTADRDRLVRELISSGSVRGREVTFLAKGGRPLTVDLSASLITIEGDPCFLTSFVDITESRQIREKLAAAHRQLQSVIDNTPALVYAIDLEERFILANAAVAGLLGSTREHLIGKRRHEFMPGADADWHEANDRKAIEADVALEIEECSQLAGRSITWLTTKFPLRDAQGKVYAIGGISVDITGRKQAEEELKASEKKLSEIYASMTEGLALHEIISDESGMAIDYRITDVNPAFEKITGLNRDRVIGKRASAVYGTGEAPYLDTYAGVASTGKPVTFEVHFAPIDRYFHISVFSPEHGKFATIFQDITARKLAEESVERFKALMDHNPSLAFLKDESGRYVYLNHAYEKHFALTKDWHGKTDFDFWPRESAELFRANDHEILQSGKAKQFLEDSMDLNGTRHCWLAYKFSFADSNNKRYVGGIGINITDRVRAEEALQKAKDELEERVMERTAELKAASHYTRSLIEASLDPLVAISPEGKITDVNLATEEVTGLMRSRLIGSDFSDYFTDPDSARAGYRRVLADGHVQDYPLTIVNASWGTTDVLYNATVYRNEEGAVQGVFAAARDVTARRRAEEAVKAERQRLFDVLETLPAMVCLLTPDYNVAFANKSFRENFGESEGRHCYEYCFGKTEPCDFCETYTVLKTGQPHRWELKSPDGRFIAAHDFPFTDADGSPLILEMDFDITDYRRAEEELIKLTQKLEKSGADLRELASELVLSEERERKRIAAVLHDEICQTLAVAKMRVDMLQKAPVDEESRKTIVEIREFLVQSIRDARDLMNEVGNPLLFDMGVAAACTSLAERLMASHPIRILCDIPDSFKDLEPDLKVILYQLIRELLNNIVKHSGADNAWVSIRTDNGRIRAEVRDDGVGFDPETLGAPTSEGGFGLFSIQERLKAFDAGLQIESAQGRGTVVKADLPSGLERSKYTDHMGR